MERTAMLERFVDGALAVAKESVETFTYETFNNIARIINGFSALLLLMIPGKISILEKRLEREFKPTFCGPRLPRWMENGVSSFNQFLHDLPDDSDYSDCSSYSDYTSAEEDNEENMVPGSPLSQSSRLSRSSSIQSRGSSFYRYDKQFLRIIKYFVSWILWPIKFLIRLPLLSYHYFRFRRCGICNEGPISEHQSAELHLKRAISVKQRFVQRTTDRRRGIIEDLQVAIEIYIESIFDIFHKGTHLIFTPSETIRMVLRWLSPQQSKNREISDKGQQDVSIPTATLGESNPTPTERQTRFHQSLNTDARTCEDVIKEHGYPYEAIRVVTSDDYVLHLERIPRHDSKKVVYLQHGILDSSLGWVSNGIVGSPAFAAFDQGYDVYLGNFRGLVSQDHIDKNISSSRYWKYSINEHGTQDVPAIIEKIHQVKTSEFNSSPKFNCQDQSIKSDQPYRICAVGHSLGGAAILMHVVTDLIAQKPHRLSRLILLSPAGFHEDSPLAFTLLEHVMLFFGSIIAPFIPGLYIPTKFFRMLFNKLARDFYNYPALGGLVQSLMSFVVGGDTSNWVGVLGLSHYNMNDMPGVSLRVAIHLAQMKHARKFLMYDFGTAATNMEVYGSSEPLDIGNNYNFIDIPVDLVAGRNDHVICPSMVKKHYTLMRKANINVSYNEFDYAHLDFTFSPREELLTYVMSRILLVAPPQEKQTIRNHVRLNKIKRNQ